MLIDVYGERKREKVMRDTWGHLAPVPRRFYDGYVIFSVSPNGDHNLLYFDFEGLDGNPWTLEHVSEWWIGETERSEFATSDHLAIWRWTGAYMVQKNGHPRFKGDHCRMSLVPAAIAKVECRPNE